MCGICGEALTDPRASASDERVRRMCARMVHRGPDDQGIRVVGEAALGARRLSIIDLETGHQPVSNEDGSVWVVQNGEIYNYRELARELRGHGFRTRSDTEVLAHLYEEEGERMFSRLEGMFAIAVWDRRRHRLLLGRDRLGIKPLVYGVIDNHGLVFASELQAILAVLHSAPPIDLEAFHHYLSLNYIPAPHTIFEGWRKLLPGHYLVWEEGQLRDEAYWDLHYPRAGGNGSLEEDARAEELREVVRRAVRRHLVSDVPVGVLLSGGIDSSTLTAMTCAETAGRVKTFSVGFTEKTYNELDYAREVARRFGTEHHETVVTPQVDELLPRLVRLWGEPYADSSAIPFYYISQLARSQVKVVLTGDGGDEVFAGYQTYAAYRAASLYRRMPSVLRGRLIPWVVNHLPVSEKKISFEYKAKRFVRGAEYPPEQAHYHWKVIFDEDAKQELYPEDVRNRLDGRDSYDVFRSYYQRARQAALLNRLLYVDAKVYLPDDILTKADSMGMANSLEARPPFLDRELVEYASTIPPGLKLRRFAKKYLLRKAMAPLLPRRILEAPKRGFNIPAARWLRRELRGMADELLAPRRLKMTGLMEVKPVRRLLEDHWEFRQDNSRLIWGLMVFMLWHEVVLNDSTAFARQ